LGNFGQIEKYDFGLHNLDFSIANFLAQNLSDFWKKVKIQVARFLNDKFIPFRSQEYTIVDPFFRKLTFTIWCIAKFG